ncbi:MAG: cytochrome c [Nostocales cyanobacterium]|nr:MAG: cytochrome c [Nostocales cyanobacterium]TAF18883.1 MAG: cytochrome c [Nostocales cyanobacterium]
MDKQPTKPETWTQGIVFSVLAILIAIPLAVVGVDMIQASDPYIKNVISRPGNPVQGKAIFLTNCAGCHGSEGTGFVGPSLQEVSKRKSRYGLIHQVISGETPPMPKFQPSPQEMADLLSYLQSL